MLPARALKCESTWSETLSPRTAPQKIDEGLFVDEANDSTLEEAAGLPREAREAKGELMVAGEQTTNVAKGSAAAAAPAAGELVEQAIVEWAPPGRATRASYKQICVHPVIGSESAAHG